MIAPAREINPAKYGKLLARTLPSVIETEAENERLLAEIERLLDKGEGRSPEEDKLLELMTTLVEDFEERHYSIPDAPPHEILQELMRARGLRQRDVLHIFGSSSGTASEVINGKRSISRAQAKALAQVFNVSPGLFL